MIGGALGVGFTGLLFQLPLSAHPTAPELVKGMSYALFYNPTIFLLSLLLIMRLPRTKSAVETGTADV
jgi:hypothetical protein